MSEVEGMAVRGRPLVKWENRAEKYMRERERGGDVCIMRGGSAGKERTGGPSALATPLVGAPREIKASELLIDKSTDIPSHQLYLFPCQSSGYKHISALYNIILT